uniref:Uncharacterized protein n=1 Tax=Corethron hystrix TaxID=216773 RepID=A0A7S1BZV5_9STRA
MATNITETTKAGKETSRTTRNQRKRKKKKNRRQRKRFKGKNGNDEAQNHLHYHAAKDIIDIIGAEARAKNLAAVETQPPVTSPCHFSLFDQEEGKDHNCDNKRLEEGDCGIKVKMEDGERKCFATNPNASDEDENEDENEDEDENGDGDGDGNKDKDEDDNESEDEDENEGEDEEESSGEIEADKDMEFESWSDAQYRLRWNSFLGKKDNYKIVSPKFPTYAEYVEFKKVNPTSDTNTPASLDVAVKNESINEVHCQLFAENMGEHSDDFIQEGGENYNANIIQGLKTIVNAKQQKEDKDKDGDGTLGTVCPPLIMTEGTADIEAFKREEQRNELQEKNSKKGFVSTASTSAISHAKEKGMHSATSPPILNDHAQFSTFNIERIIDIQKCEFPSNEPFLTPDNSALSDEEHELNPIKLYQGTLGAGYLLASSSVAVTPLLPAVPLLVGSLVADVVGRRHVLSGKWNFVGADYTDPKTAPAQNFEFLQHFPQNHKGDISALPLMGPQKFQGYFNMLLLQERKGRIDGKKSMTRKVMAVEEHELNLQFLRNDDIYIYNHNSDVCYDSAVHIGFKICGHGSNKYGRFKISGHGRKYLFSKKIDVRLLKSYCSGEKEINNNKEKKDEEAVKELNLIYTKYSTEERHKNINEKAKIEKKKAEERDKERNEQIGQLWTDANADITASRKKNNEEEHSVDSSSDTGHHNLIISTERTMQDQIARSTNATGQCVNVKREKNCLLQAKKNVVLPSTTLLSPQDGKGSKERSTVSLGGLRSQTKIRSTAVPPTNSLPEGQKAKRGALASNNCLKVKVKDSSSSKNMIATTKMTKAISTVMPSSNGNSDINKNDYMDSIDDSTRRTPKKTNNRGRQSLRSDVAKNSIRNRSNTISFQQHLKNLYFSSVLTGGLTTTLVKQIVKTMQSSSVVSVAFLCSSFPSVSYQTMRSLYHNLFETSLADSTLWITLKKTELPFTTHEFEILIYDLFADTKERQKLITYRSHVDLFLALDYVDQKNKRGQNNPAGDSYSEKKSEKNCFD